MTASVVDSIVSALDPRLRDAFRKGLRSKSLPGSSAALEGKKVVLVGHRAAGKTRLLPLIAQLVSRPGFDLDKEIEARHRRSLREWVVTDEASFRAAERQVFSALSNDSVIAVGGGFLSKHADLLADHLPVLVPITFETYRERLLADRSRPRLLPNIPLEEEIQRVFSEREVLHARGRSMPLLDFVAVHQRRPA